MRNDTRVGITTPASVLCAVNAHDFVVGNFTRSRNIRFDSHYPDTSEVTMSKKTLISLALAAALAPCAASAQNAIATEGPWLVRVRAAYMLNDNSNDPTLSLGKIEVEDKWIPEFDITYFFTDNIAVELVLTWPQKMDVTLAGTDVGSVKALPPTLSVQYHFTPNQPLRPYVGIGINYTQFSSEDFTVARRQRFQLELGRVVAGRARLQDRAALVPERRRQVHVDGHRRVAQWRPADDGGHQPVAAVSRRWLPLLVARTVPNR